MTRRRSGGKRAEARRLAVEQCSFEFLQRQCRSLRSGAHTKDGANEKTRD